MNHKSGALTTTSPNHYLCTYHCSAEDEKANGGEKKPKKKKKKKKDKKRTMAVKKEPGVAIIAKLHLADNGIDGLHTSDYNHRPALIDFLQLCRWSAQSVIVLYWSFSTQWQLYETAKRKICETSTRSLSNYKHKVKTQAVFCCIYNTATTESATCRNRDDDDDDKLPI